MSLYESEHTKFIREFFEKNPDEKREQAAGRSLWWDQAPRSLDEMARQKAARVATKPYYYDAN